MYLSARKKVSYLLEMGSINGNSIRLLILHMGQRLASGSFLCQTIKLVKKKSIKQMFERIDNVSVQVGSERAWLLRECNPVRQAQSGLPPTHLWGVSRKQWALD